jgi:hypothetical protein
MTHEQLLADRVLRAEEVVERRDREARFARDGGHGRRAEASPGEEPLGRREHLVHVTGSVAAAGGPERFAGGAHGN